MALSYYKLIFGDGQEYIVEHLSNDVKKIISAVSDGLTSSEYLQMRYKEGAVLYIKKDRLVSIQKQPNETIGAHTKVWSLG